MPNYEPMSREAHLKRGTCCDNGCVYCPWRLVRKYPEPDPRPLMLEAMQILKEDPDAVMTLYSSKSAIVPELVLQERLTVRYGTH